MLYVIFSSPVFVWGVTLDIDGESDISDNCFDLIPGVPYIVKIANKNNLEVKTTGNNLMISIKNK